MRRRSPWHSPPGSVLRESGTGAPNPPRNPSARRTQEQELREAGATSIRCRTGGFACPHFGPGRLDRRNRLSYIYFGICCPRGPMNSGCLFPVGVADLSVFLPCLFLSSSTVGRKL